MPLDHRGLVSQVLPVNSGTRALHSCSTDFLNGPLGRKFDSIAALANRRQRFSAGGPATGVT